MNDRELLEAAAKAANIELRWHPDGTAFADQRCKNYWGVWNPLKDDGDALRLAVALEINIRFDQIESYVMATHPDTSYGESEDYANDRNAATRRAIVRAAAELGSRS